MRWLNSITNSRENEFEQTPGDSEGQRSLVCCSPWGPKESDTDEQLKHDAFIRKHDAFIRNSQTQPGSLWRELRSTDTWPAQ